VADKGYSFPSIRAELRRRGIAAAIPTRTNQRRRSGLDREAYRQRNRVERSVGRLKQLRWVATRYQSWPATTSHRHPSRHRGLAMTGLPTRPCGQAFGTEVAAAPSEAEADALPRPRQDRRR
jgi:transposase